jgi:hypothetical protein
LRDQRLVLAQKLLEVSAAPWQYGSFVVQRFGPRDPAVERHGRLQDKKGMQAMATSLAQGGHPQSAPDWFALVGIVVTVALHLALQSQ